MENNLIESFEDFFKEYQSGLIESSNEEVDLNRRKFLLERLYINESVGDQILGLASQGWQQAKGVIKSKLPNPKLALQQTASNIKQRVADAESKGIQQRQQKMQNEINNPNLTSYQRMRMQQKMANKMLNNKPMFKQNHQQIQDATRKLRLNKRTNESD